MRLNEIDTNRSNAFHSLIWMSINDSLWHYINDVLRPSYSLLIWDLVINSVSNLVRDNVRDNVKVLFVNSIRDEIRGNDETL
jgi:hypothetical protein